ncbi:hypothetical protein Pan153_08020 [Gimesia panareensis]|uniref:Uncharacterized protein n=1 Tax=Gimesia panareensis TaxID=2527978 RepID=A0A518FIK6_9PLAN|nr:hypothetical protein Pan153_08020 [Gimesia panareensis]
MNEVFIIHYSISQPQTRKNHINHKYIRRCSEPDSTNSNNLILNSALNQLAEAAPLDML